MSGAILESWAVGEVIRSYWHAGRQAPVFLLSRQGPEGNRPADLSRRKALPDRGQKDDSAV